MIIPFVDRVSFAASGKWAVASMSYVAIATFLIAVTVGVLDGFLSYGFIMFALIGALSATSAILGVFGKSEEEEDDEDND